MLAFRQINHDQSAKYLSPEPDPAIRSQAIARRPFSREPYPATEFSFESLKNNVKLEFSPSLAPTQTLPVRSNLFSLHAYTYREIYL